MEPPEPGSQTGTWTGVWEGGWSPEVMADNLIAAP